MGPKVPMSLVPVGETRAKKETLAMALLLTPN
jgi:hypothetical protein